MDLPVDIKSVLEAAKSIESARNEPVNAYLLIDPTAPADLAENVRAVFQPQSPGASLLEEDLAFATFGYDATTDFACLVAGSNARCGQVADGIRGAGIPVMVVAASADFVADTARKNGHAIPSGDLLDGSDVDDLVRLMGKWVLAVTKRKKLAVAQAFSFVRRPLAEESIKATSVQNAGVGAVMFIPGADMPVMTLNQVKMLLQIAASYGQAMDAGRVKELAGVLAGGFAARTVARQLVGLVPVAGWAVKGGIGYSATMAMGYAALNYFEGGGGLAGLGHIANSAGEAAVKAADTAKNGATKGKDAIMDSKPVRTVVGLAGIAAGAAQSAGSKVSQGAKSAASTLLRKVKKGVKQEETALAVTDARPESAVEPAEYTVISVASATVDSEA